MAGINILLFYLLFSSPLLFANNENLLKDGSDYLIEEDDSNGGTEGLSHPFSANAWRTRELLMTNKLPSRQKLYTCQNELYALSDNSINEESMLSSIQVLVPTIEKNRDLYHWCFYDAVSNLDSKLESNELNRNYKKKYDFFIQRMKALWILARALDTAMSTKIYFGYLRIRFLNISKIHFGRHLEIINPPLGDKGRYFPNYKKKPASPNFPDY